MIETIKLDSGREVQLASSAAFLYIYQNQFREDPFEKLFTMIKEVQDFMTEGEDTEEEQEPKSEVDTFGLMQKIDILFLSNLTWALAKNADGSIPGPIEFYQNNPDFLPLNHVDVIVNLATNSLVSTGEIPEKNQTSPQANQ
jgi:hypothetical protein